MDSIRLNGGTANDVFSLSSVIALPDVIVLVHLESMLVLTLPGSIFNNLFDKSHSSIVSLFFAILVPFSPRNFLISILSIMSFRANDLLDITDVLYLGPVGFCRFCGRSFEEKTMDGRSIGFDEISQVLYHLKNKHFACLIVDDFNLQRDQYNTWICPKCRCTSSSYNLFS